MQDSLQTQRIQAAMITRGISTQSVHRLGLKLCSQVDLGDRLLDYGSGSGDLIRELLQSGYRGVVTGIDIMERPADMPEGTVDWVAADLNEAAPLPDQSFSSIVSMEVIEHLENPRFIFREFFRLLRPGGVLIVTTPNQESIRSLAGLVIGGHFTAFLGANYPAHITALLRLDFERICREAGFEPPVFSYSDIGQIPKMTSISWQQISLGLCGGRLFTDTIALIARKP